MLLSLELHFCWYWTFLNILSGYVHFLRSVFQVVCPFLSGASYFLVEFYEFLIYPGYSFGVQTFSHGLLKISMYSFHCCAEVSDFDTMPFFSVYDWVTYSFQVWSQTSWLLNQCTHMPSLQVPEAIRSFRPFLEVCDPSSDIVLDDRYESSSPACTSVLPDLFFQYILDTSIKHQLVIYMWLKFWSLFYFNNLCVDFYAGKCCFNRVL